MNNHLCLFDFPPRQKKYLERDIGCNKNQNCKTFFLYAKKNASLHKFLSQCHVVSSLPMHGNLFQSSILLFPVCQCKDISLRVPFCCFQFANAWRFLSECHFVVSSLPMHGNFFQNAMFLPFPLLIAHAYSKQAMTNTIL